MASVKLSALPLLGEGDVRHVGQRRQPVSRPHDRGIERLAGQVAFEVRSKLPYPPYSAGGADGIVRVGRGDDPRIEVRMHSPVSACQTPRLRAEFSGHDLRVRSAMRSLGDDVVGSDGRRR